MADLRIRDELRLALAGGRAPGRPETTEAARRLGRALSRDRLARGLTAKELGTGGRIDVDLKTGQYVLSGKRPTLVFEPADEGGKARN